MTRNFAVSCCSCAKYSFTTTTTTSCVPILSGAFQLRDFISSAFAFDCLIEHRMPPAWSARVRLIKYYTYNKINTSVMMPPVMLSIYTLPGLITRSIDEIRFVNE
uniref:Uncharacterized protein n=1 Tax=Glossina pallidipes TaxID=7398 RepID=A0A1A9Z3B9_GLOPL